MQKPQVNKIKPDIKNASIYLRSTKKFGKTTLFRDVVLEKYGDCQKGLLIACGAEIGYTFLDNLNYSHVNTYQDIVELKDWLIKEKGKEHNIEMIAFDTGDEFVQLSDEEAIKHSNKENPTKRVKSIKAAFGGFTNGEKYSANKLIKPILTELRLAGFGVWVLAHTKYKTIREKGSLDEEGYMQLTSNISADYESAFGDCLDIVATGVLEKEIEERGEGDDKKRYVVGSSRRLYFRDETIIDAGGRFSYGAIPDSIPFDKPNMAREFIDLIEKGMENSKTDTKPKKAAKPKKEKVEVVEQVEEEIEDIEEEIIEEVEEESIELDAETEEVEAGDIDEEDGEELFDDLEDEEDNTINIEEMREEIRTLYKACDKETKGSVTKIIKKNGGSLNTLEEDALQEIYEILR